MKELTGNLKVVLISLVFLFSFTYGEEIPSHWTGDTGIELSKETSIVYEGSHSCKVIVNTTAQENCDMYHDAVNVTSGNSYTYSFYIQTSEHVTARIILQWTGEIMTTANYSPISTSSFTQVTFSGTVPQSVSDVKIGIRFYDQEGFSAPETQYVDNFTFESPTSTSIPLANGNMESWPSIPTPITLSSFTAETSNGKIGLLWETASETDNSHFLIYRNNEVIAFVEGAGSTSEPHCYEYVDDQVIQGNTYTYILADISYANAETKYTDKAITITIPTRDISTKFILENNHPNPFNPSTTISYQLTTNNEVDVTIYDLAGRKISTLVNDYQPAGYHAVNWNATPFPSGIYFYRLRAGDFVETKKMVLMK